MGKIKKILENELVGGTQTIDVYPVTSIKAVYDENNERLDNIINRSGIINISTNYNSDHLLDTLTITEAINKVPSKDRVLGFQGKFLSSNGWKQILFKGDTISKWSDISYWVVTSIDENVNKFVFTNSEYVNAGLKELYLPDIDMSKNPYFLIFRKYTDGNFPLGRIQIIIYNDDGKYYEFSTTDMDTTLVKYKGGIGYILFDMSSKNFLNPNPGPIHATINSKCKILDYSPTIKGILSYLDKSSIDDTLSYSNNKLPTSKIVQDNTNGFVYVNSGKYNKFIKELYIKGLPANIDISKFRCRSARYGGITESPSNWQFYLRYIDTDELFGLNFPDNDGTANINTVLKFNVIPNKPEYADIEIYALLDWDYLFNVGKRLGEDSTPLNKLCLFLDKSPSIKDYFTTKKIYEVSSTQPFMKYLSPDIYEEFMQYIDNIEVEFINKNYIPEQKSQYLSVGFYRHILGSETQIDRIQVALVIVDKDTKQAYSTFIIEFLTSSPNILSKSTTNNNIKIKLTVKPEIYNLPAQDATYPITWIFSKNIIKDITYNVYSSEDIDYDKYFSSRLLRNCYSSNTDKEYLRSRLAPFLEVGKFVLNGGTLRQFCGATYNSFYESNMWDVFEECPYKNSTALWYDRISWYMLESSKNNYSFDTVIEPLLKKCIDKKARIVIGLPIMAYSSINDYGGFDIDSKSQKRYYSVPQYLYEELKVSDYPMYEDNTYNIWYSPNYDSPLLLNRFKKLLEAFSIWLEGTVTGTSIKRKDVIFAIEQRYFGYWGEGTINNNFHPKTNLYDEYNNSYFEFFPDKIIIMGGQEFLHAPLYTSDMTDEINIVKMKHIYNSLTSKNSKGNVGIFRDSWAPYDNKYDIISSCVIMDNNNNIIPLAKKLTEILPNAHTTGEFAYFANTNSNSKGLVPYQILYTSFKRMCMSSISLHNYTITGNNDLPNGVNPLGLYQIARDCLSMVGYRIVINSPTVTKNTNNYSIKIVFCNIGLSKVFADYYKVHLIVKGDDGSIISDNIADFDFGDIPVSKTTEPLSYDPTYGKVLKATIPLLPEGKTTGKLYLRIDDEKGIEYPMTLSNYGRELESKGGDGSYFITTLN